MNRFRMLAPAVLLLAALVSVVACNSDSGSSVLSRSGLGVDDRVTVTADPQEIVIDTTDPNVPTDPDTTEPIGTSTITALVRDTAGEPEVGVEVTFMTDGGTLASEGAPIMTNDQGVAQDTLTVAVSDPDSITVQATAGEDSGTVMVTKVVIVPNEPPVADAGPDQTVECGMPVTLDGSGSTDDVAIVSYVWTEGMTDLGEGEMLTLDSAELGVGMHTITLTVSDEEDLTGTDDTLVTVEDTTPPDVTLAADPAEIWPPNHKWVSVNVTPMTDDPCTPLDQLTFELISLESNESPNANGDGNFEPDVKDYEIGTADFSFSVRAERAGPGSGRVYTAVYRIVDPSANEAMATVEIRVPHDQGH